MPMASAISHLLVLECKFFTKNSHLIAIIHPQICCIQMNKIRKFLRWNVYVRAFVLLYELLLGNKYACKHNSVIF